MFTYRTVKKVYSYYERYLPGLVILALILGVIIAKYSPVIGSIASSFMNALIDGITLIAPLAIFIVVAPSMAYIIKARKETRFAGFVLGWFSLTRAMAGVWAAIFTVTVLGLPLIAHRSGEGYGAILLHNLVLMGDLLLKSPTLLAIYASIILGVVAYYSRRVYRLMDFLAKGLETGGSYIQAVIPVIMLLLGAYIYSLPTLLRQSLETEGMDRAQVLSSLSNINILGVSINLGGDFGLLYLYAIQVVMLVAGCFIWQMAQLIIVKLRMKEFSIRKFVVKYYIRVYPLAWSTASEAASVALNTAEIKNAYPEVDKNVRRLFCGLGGHLNINGTTMSVFCLTGIVATVCGADISLAHLLLALPVVILIGYGVPGVPGELVFYAVPMMTLLNIPPDTQPVFLALFLALQIGLPDSFRTGANVTDNGIYAVGFNKRYKEKYALAKEPIPTPSDVRAHQDHKTAVFPLRKNVSCSENMVNEESVTLSGKA